MSKHFKYLPSNERKKILLICDDIRVHSGVATVAKEMVLHTSQHFNWVQIAGAIKHPDKGKVFDLSIDTHSETMSHLSIPKVILPPYKGWGDILRWILKENVPGEFPYTAGVFPFKREEEDPTRMFAGSGASATLGAITSSVISVDGYPRAVAYTLTFVAAFTPVTGKYAKDKESARRLTTRHLGNFFHTGRAAKKGKRNTRYWVMGFAPDDAEREPSREQ